MSTRDIVQVKGNEILEEIDLLKDVTFDNYKYVGIIGIVVSGEWTLPDNVKGGVTISFIDKRLQDPKEAILGTYRAPAKGKRFQFKLIPNYSVASVDAKRKPWQVHIRLSGLKVEEGWSPLSVEIVSVTMRSNNIITKGLKERIVNIGDANVEKFEGVVDEFVDSIPASSSLARMRSKGKFKGSGLGPEKNAGTGKFNKDKKNVLHNNHTTTVPVHGQSLGRSNHVERPSREFTRSTFPNSSRKGPSQESVFQRAKNSSDRESTVSSTGLSDLHDVSSDESYLPSAYEGFRYEE